MSKVWTPEQVLKLAPDASAAKAGRELASAKKWTELGCDPGAIWGACQGSAAEPYRTSLDPSEPAYRCTCPSRKFPCKHSLALFLLFAQEPQLFGAEARPDWVEKWMEGRTKRQRQREETTRDPEAQKRRAGDREAKVAQGIEELNLWLRDLLRGGLAGIEARPDDFWQRTAARLIDAQASGLARSIRRLGEIPGSRADWPERLLEGLARLHLIVEGFRRISELPESLAADVRTAIGFTQTQESVQTNGTRCKDVWVAWGQKIEEEDGLRTRRLWLQGRTTGRFALLLSHAFGRDPMETLILPGLETESELAFYPSAVPLRAVLATPSDLQDTDGEASQTAGIRASLSAFGKALAACPWLDLYPMLLGQVLPQRQGEVWLLRDAEDRVLPLAPAFPHAWQLLALGGGRPMTVFGEWNGQTLFPLSAWAEDRLTTF